MATITEPLLLTPREVAALLRTTREEVYCLLRSGQLRGARRGSHWMVSRAAVEEYAAAWGQSGEGAR